MFFFGVVSARPQKRRTRESWHLRARSVRLAGPDFLSGLPAIAGANQASERRVPRAMRPGRGPSVRSRFPGPHRRRRMRRQDQHLLRRRGKDQGSVDRSHTRIFARKLGRRTHLSAKPRPSATSALFFSTRAYNQNEFAFNCSRFDPRCHLGDRSPDDLLVKFGNFPRQQ